jgi:hypothetical protein
LVSSAGTAVGLWVGRRLKGREWDDDGDGESDVEMGKRS